MLSPADLIHMVMETTTTTNVDTPALAAPICDLSAISRYLQSPAFGNHYYFVKTDTTKKNNPRVHNMGPNEFWHLAVQIRSHRPHIKDAPSPLAMIKGMESTVPTISEMLRVLRSNTFMSQPSIAQVRSQCKLHHGVELPIETIMDMLKALHIRRHVILSAPTQTITMLDHG